MPRRASPSRAIALAICAAIATSAASIAGPAAKDGGASAAPIYGLTIPDGYRDWRVISIGSLRTADLDQLRVQLGNDPAIKAYRASMPFPDGAIIAAIHWKNMRSEGNDAALASAFRGAQSFVPGDRVNIQLMVKDSKRFASTGGWGFADFRDGKPGSLALHQTCFACHTKARAHDFVFARYAQ